MDALTAINVQPGADSANGAPATGVTAADPADGTNAQAPLSFQSLLIQFRLAHPAKTALPLSAAGKQQPAADAAPEDKSQTQALDPAQTDAASAALPLVMLQPVANNSETASSDPALKEQAALTEPTGENRTKDTHARAREAALPEAARISPPGKDLTPAVKPAEAANFTGPGTPLPQAVTDERNKSAAIADTNLQAIPQMPQAVSMTHANAASTPVATAQLAAPVASPMWGNELGQRLVLMIGEKQHVAELHLNPPHLGPLDVTLTVDGSQTSAVFTSPHGAVRDAISNELPRLREILADSGITLGNASVTADTPRDGAAFAPEQQSRRGPLGDAGTQTVTGQSSAAPITRRIGLVDLFA